MAYKVTATQPALYSKLKDDLAKDRGHCAVIALAAICKIDAAGAQAALAAAGRKPRCGTKSITIRKALEAMGYTVTVWTIKQRRALIASYPGRAIKLESITTHHPRRFPTAWAGQPDMLMFSPEHVSAFVDGEVCDWAIKHSKRVREIWTISKEPAA